MMYSVTKTGLLAVLLNRTKAANRVIHEAPKTWDTRFAYEETQVGSDIYDTGVRGKIYNSLHDKMSHAEFRRDLGRLSPHAQPPHLDTQRTSASNGSGQSDRSGWPKPASSTGSDRLSRAQADQTFESKVDSVKSELLSFFLNDPVENESEERESQLRYLKQKLRGLHYERNPWEKNIPEWVVKEVDKVVTQVEFYAKWKQLKKMKNNNASQADKDACTGSLERLAQLLYEKFDKTSSLLTKAYLKVSQLLDYLLAQKDEWERQRRSSYCLTQADAFFVHRVVETARFFYDRAPKQGYTYPAGLDVSFAKSLLHYVNRHASNQLTEEDKSFYDMCCKLAPLIPVKRII